VTASWRPFAFDPETQGMWASKRGRESRRVREGNMKKKFMSLNKKHFRTFFIQDCTKLDCFAFLSMTIYSAPSLREAKQQSNPEMLSFKSKLL